MSVAGSVPLSGAATVNGSTLIKAADKVEVHIYLSRVLKDNFIPGDYYQRRPVEVIDALTSGVTNAVYGVYQAYGVKAISFH